MTSSKIAKFFPPPSIDPDYLTKGTQFVRKGAYWLILALLLYFVLETFSWLSLLLLKKTRGMEYSPAPTVTLSDTQKESIYLFLNDKTRYLEHSPALGWTIKKDGRLGIYRANSQGIRADREYPFSPPQGVVRISTFGDSYTHCDDVRNEDTWQVQMEAAGDGLEILNFGVPAYGLDQAFLRYYQDGVRYNSDIVFIGFMSENVNRHVNVFRPFYTPSPYWPFTKPRFTVKDGKLHLLENPMYEPSKYYSLLESPEVALPELGANDFHFNFSTRYRQGPLDFLPSVRLVKMAVHKAMEAGEGSSSIIRDGYYNRDSEAYKITERLFDKFVEQVTKNGSLPIIVLLPNQDDVARYRKDRAKVYAPLLERFDSKGYRYVDVIHVLDTYGTDISADDLASELFVQDPSVHRSFHYSASTNERIAAYLLDYLQEEGLTSADAVRQKTIKPAP